MKNGTKRTLIALLPILVLVGLLAADIGWKIVKKAL